MYWTLSRQHNSTSHCAAQNATCALPSVVKYTLYTTRVHSFVKRDNDGKYVCDIFLSSWIYCFLAYYANFFEQQYLCFFFTRLFLVFIHWTPYNSQAFKLRYGVWCFVTVNGLSPRPFRYDQESSMGTVQWRRNLRCGRTLTITVRDILEGFCCGD